MDPSRRRQLEVLSTLAWPILAPLFAFALAALLVPLIARLLH
jgi:hypothetical protein